MPKIWSIALTEYLNAVRSKAFIIGIVLLPVMMLGGIGLQHLVRNKVDLADKKFGVLDRTGRFSQLLEDRARTRNDVQAWVRSSNAPPRKIRPAFVPIAVSTNQTDDQAEFSLSEQVRRKELFAFVIISPDAIASQTGPASIRYYTQTPTFTDLSSWLEFTLNEGITGVRLREAGLDPAMVARLSASVPLKRMGLSSKDAGGKITKARGENTLARFAVPFISMMLLFMLIMTSAPTLLNTVLEEKMQKIAEVLVSSVTPFQLMLGKLLAAIMSSFTLSALYLGSTIFLLRVLGVSEFVPATHFAWFLLFQLLGLMIFGSIFMALGAACSEIRDAQNMMMPAMMLIMIPMFVWVPIMQSPGSSFARALSLFPPFTPLLMMLRISVPPGPPWWEVLLGVVLTTLFMLATVWASGRIFRVGILFQGQTPSFRKLIGWLWVR